MLQYGFDECAAGECAANFSTVSRIDSVQIGQTSWVAVLSFSSPALGSVELESALEAGGRPPPPGLIFGLTRHRVAVNTSCFPTQIRYLRQTSHLSHYFQFGLTL